MRRILYFRIDFASLAVGLFPGGSALHGQIPTSAVVATIQIPDGTIVGLSVGANGELAVYDRTPLASNSLLRFFVASLDKSQVVVTEAPETGVLVGDAPGFKGRIHPLQQDGGDHRRRTVGGPRRFSLRGERIHPQTGRRGGGEQRSASTTPYTPSRRQRPGSRFSRTASRAAIQAGGAPPRSRGMKVQ